MTGTINQFRQAIVRLSIFGDGGVRRDVACVVDTGFTGFLTLPPDVVGSLKLPYRRLESVLRADGSTMTFLVYEAAIMWHGETRSVDVLASEGPTLLGMSLMDGSLLTVRVRVGGTLTIAKDPQLSVERASRWPE